MNIDYGKYNLFVLHYAQMEALIIFALCILTIFTQSGSVITMRIHFDIQLQKTAIYIFL